MPTLPYSRPFSNVDGDKWISIGEDIEAQSLLVEYQSSVIPETWQFIGRLYKCRFVGTRWSVEETVALYPGQMNLIRWQHASKPYKLLVRFPKYIKSGTLTITEPPAISATMGQYLRLNANAAVSLVNISSGITSGQSFIKVAGSGANQQGSATFVMPPSFVAGEYDIYVKGTEVVGQTGILTLFINGGGRLAFCWNSSSSGATTAKVAGHEFLAPGSTIRFDMTGNNTDRAQIDWLDLVPTPP